MSGDDDALRLRLSATDHLLFIDKAIDEMVAIVTELGDADANRRPGLPGGNSPYQLLVHCLGVCEYWGGAMIAGRSIDRDRAAEFTASGPTEPLRERARAAQQRFRRDLELFRADEPTTAKLPRDWEPSGAERAFTHAEALVHVVVELSQHLGHMEITRDLLRRDT